MNFIKYVQPKVLALCAWDRICAVDEHFFAEYIFMFNAGFTLIMSFSRWMFGSLNGIRYAFFKGSYTDTLSDKKYFWPIFGGINLTILIVGVLVIIKQKINNERVINPLINNSNFNNMAYNKPLLNTRQTFVSMFILLSLVFWNVLRASSHTIKTADFLRIPLFVYIIFPISGLFGRITFTKFILREVKNFFGNL